MQAVPGRHGSARRRGSRLSAAALKAMLFATLCLPLAAMPGEAAESFRGRQARPLDDARILQLKSFLAESMSALAIPGVSFALIDANSVVFEGGLGVRLYDRPEMVDADTLFPAGANTTALTTLLLAQLVDDGRLAWEQPVSSLQPAFRLGDAAYTKQLRVSDLVCGCIDVPGTKLQWLAQFRTITPGAVLNPVTPLQPRSAPGQRYSFSLPLVSAAGYLGAALAYPRLETGHAYELAMQDRVLRPIGMRMSTFDLQRALAANHAEPHGLAPDGKPARADGVLGRAVQSYRPAAGLWTSARELIRYVRLELQLGRLPNGRQLVSQDNMLLRRLPQTPIDADRRYGLGLEVDKTWGVQVIHHGGDLGGYQSDMYLLPEYGVGAVLLTNSSGGGRLLRPFLHRLLEVLFAEDPAAERGAAAELALAAAQLKAGNAARLKSLVLPADATAAGALAPRYRNAELGDLVVQRGPKATVFDFGGWSSPVASRRNADGTVSFVTTAPTLEGYEFLSTAKGGKRSLSIRDGEHDYLFMESP